MEVSQGVLFGAVSMLSWGCSDFFAAKSVRGSNSFRALLWSQIIALALMIPIFLKYYSIPPLSLKITALILAAGITTVVANLAFFKSLHVGKVSLVMPVASCWAVVTVFLSIAFLKEALTGMQTIGVTLAILGAVLVSFRLKDLAKLKNHVKGINYAAIAAIAYGTDFVLIDMMVAEIGWFLPVLFIGGITAVYLLVYSGATKKDISFPKNVLVFIVLVGVLDTVAYIAYSIGITSAYGSIVAPIGAASPAVSVILARTFFKEKLEKNQEIGVISVLAGLILLSV